MSKERIVYIGRKPIPSYIMTVLSTGSGKVIISARGMLISREVSVAEATKRHAEMIGKSVKIERVEIGSEFLGDPPKPVSFIRIEVEVE